MLSDLPKDLAEEVLSKLPVTSLRGARSTCKKWNTLSTNQSFTMKHIGAAKNEQSEEFQVVMMIQYRVCLMSVNLLNPSIDRIGKLISLDDEDGVKISKIFHCDGLLLCITKDGSTSRLVVWNPYTGQTRWIEPRTSYHMLLDRYALGYDQHSHKVLRFVDDHDPSVRVNVKRFIRVFEIYNLNSNSWNVLHINPDWNIEHHQRGVTLHGNTYWYAQGKVPHDAPSVISDLPDFLICFDFTTEKFGPRLPLPFHVFEETVTLSSVREKHLAVLFHLDVGYTVKIWISSKIEPNAVSWNKLFLSVDMKPLIHFPFLEVGCSFFVDEKKKLAVVLDKDRSRRGPTRNIAYIIGENGYFDKVDIGESIDAGCWPLVCSYVPSSVQIRQPAPQGNRNTP